ncbi:long-chain fatty acid transport protein 2-like isoform X1 [Osmerus eperlanus]|uniref:long-chain fatty acid transport protein 2-like isoform X1 n=2 Tax=Osmerus eperlanus TaxID=29151 RepID=UPI002E10D1F3
MSMWIGFLAVCLCIGILRYLYPYFLKDVQFVLRTSKIGYRLAKYRETNYTILDRFLDSVKRHPHKSFIHYNDVTYSYSETDQKSNKVARALLEHSPLTEGDTVALFLGNEPFFLWIWLGLAKIGCAAAFLNYNMRTKSLLHCFSCSGAKVLIAAEELKETVEEILPTLMEQNVSVYILTDECTTAGMHSFKDKISQASGEPLPIRVRSRVTLGSPAVYIYTSGTTGLPKAAMINYQRLWAMSFLQSIAGVCSTDVMYINLPLYHTAGFMGFTGAIERGITIVLRSKFSASQFWEDCRKFNVTVIQYIGETMRYLCNTPEKYNDKNHKVKIAIGNGIRADVWKEFLNRFGNISIKELYASTEGNMSFINYAGKIGAVGRVNFFHKRAFPYALIKYDTEEGDPLRDSKGFCMEAAKGETGLLISQITQKAPFIGYARDLQQTERKRLHNVFQKSDLYFNTGDLLSTDQEGFLYFQDRIGDTFRWKGENVSTNEVSDILTMAHCIEEANVYGVQIPGQEGRAGMAAITLREGVQFDGASLFKHVEAYLPAYARPRFLRIQSSLSVTGTFKQMKGKLVGEGFSPDRVTVPLFFLDEKLRSYQPLTPQIFHTVESGGLKL